MLNNFQNKFKTVQLPKMNLIFEDKENKIENDDNMEEDHEPVDRQLGHGCIDKIVFKNFL